MMRNRNSLAILTLLSACAGIDAPAPEPQPAMPPPAEPETSPEGAVSIMLERARADRLAGRLGEAEATLEAALRIEPGDARLWLELAEIQFAAGEFDAAANLAERALTLAGSDATIIEAASRIAAQTAE